MMETRIRGARLRGLTHRVMELVAVIKGIYIRNSRVHKIKVL